MESYPMAVVTAPGKIDFIDKKLPEFGTHDVLIQVKATAICGSDLHIYKGKHPSAPLPVAVGHEIAGQVIQAGTGVTNLTVGDRVAVEPVVTCNACYFCQHGQYHLCTNISFQYRVGQGGFAPFFIVNERWAHKLPENISYKVGALIEPLSVAVHAVRRSGFELGMTGAVFGDGAIGLMTMMVLSRAGTSNTFVVGIQDHRLEAAAALGAHEVINNLNQDAIEQIMSGTYGMGVDRSFEAVGIETTLVQSLESLKKGGVATLLGIFEKPDVLIPANMFIQKEITLSGSQGYNWDFQRAIKIAGENDFPLERLVTHTLPLSKIGEGFEMLLDESKHALKIIIQQD